MIPFALALLQIQSIPLTPFFDDGGTKMMGSEPALVPLIRKGPRQTGAIRFGAKSIPILIVDEKGSRALYVGGEKKKTPVQRQDVKAPDGKSVAIYQAQIDLSGAAQYSVRFFVSDTHAEGFDRVRDQLVLLSRFGYFATARFGGKSMRFGIRGGDPKSATLVIDRDGDGRLGTSPPEVYQLGKPFNIGGTTYKLSSLNLVGRPSVAFAISPQKVAEVPLPPDLRVGKIVPAVPGKTLGGKAVTFPKSWPGKIVLLDVWATWCGPCVGEIPYMKAAYAKHHGRGFEIVSYSIDDPGMQGQVASFTKAKGASWIQVYQGMGWKSPVCQRFNIRAIPFFLLVDGSTGKILATENSLRGPNLEPTIAGQLAMRGR